MTEPDSHPSCYFGFVALDRALYGVGCHRHGQLPHACPLVLVLVSVLVSVLVLVVLFFALVFVSVLVLVVALELV